MLSEDLIEQLAGSWTNPDLHKSQASEEDIERYTNGECHTFAVALHRMTRWTIHVVLDDADHHWEFDDDEFIPAVPHVVVEDDEGYFWDVKGKRPRNGFFEEMTRDFDIEEYNSDGGLDEDGLRYYVGSWQGEFDDEEVDRPLPEYDEADIAAAEDVVRRVLANVPGFPSAAAPRA